ncbi:MAG: polynucleotide adenylyltransferase/metal dependent phosphohydrolase [Parcubacteria group bacterium Gr01-1014_3]|nr:MAG: polynucleotide adenylyltransferase/metal dependent phosphohydrolase [Parcubacteria group bacterium Gr01-1014_3]
MLKVPSEVNEVAKKLAEHKHESYLVGGCLRDLLIGRTPHDWDLATSATPTELQKIFPDSVYENQFGTVGVKTDSKDPDLKIIEVTTFRKEGKYTDKRHPDEVVFAKNIEDDLARRDFTVNAMAWNPKRGIVDPFGGEKDLKKKIIRAVGKPAERFNEDALRLMRAVRFSAQLDFEIEKETLAAIKKSAGLIEFIAKERIRDELSKLLIADKAAEGIVAMQETGLLKFVLPEIEEGVGVGQNKHHIYSVFEHNWRSLEYAAKKKFPLDLRIASLLHDVGKPRTKKGNGLDSTFYGHQVVGEKIALRLLDRLKYPKAMIEKIALLIREHMFVYDPESVTLRGVRRLISRVGQDNMDDLIKIREADRIGSGVPKAQPYRLRYLQAMIEKVKKDPIGPKMIAANGTDIMKALKIEPGPIVGYIIAILLEEILDEPKLNNKEKLLDRALELGKLSEKDLRTLSEKSKKSAQEAQGRIDEEIKKKYFV